MIIVFYIQYSINLFQKYTVQDTKNKKRKCGDYEKLPFKYFSNSNKNFDIFIKMII